VQAGNSMPLPADELTVMIRAGSKIAARRIPSATSLPTSMGQGYAAEAATRDAATLWGLPDFVYEAGEQRVGPGTRELGDGILIIGELGIVLQVKSRTASSSDPEKERRWLEKNIAQALAQGAGTIRQLGRKPAALTNLRGRTIDIDGSDHRWLVVVVIDHPGPPGGLQPPLAEAHPSVVLLRRDWEFLFDQLKSTRRRPVLRAGRRRPARTRERATSILRTGARRRRNRAGGARWPRADDFGTVAAARTGRQRRPGSALHGQGGPGGDRLAEVPGG